MELEWVEAPPPRSRSSRQPWHAVAVVASGEACAAAAGMTGRRFLSAEAPRLPLSDCTCAARCPCIYRHFADRRGQPRRASERTGIPATRRAHDEQRTGRGRRATDV